MPLESYGCDHVIVWVIFNNLPVTQFMIALENTYSLKVGH